MIRLAQLIEKACLGPFTSTRKEALSSRRRPKAKPASLPKALQVEALEAREVLNGTGPHADNPALQAEHQAVMDLVKYENVTHAALSNGNWSSASTWQNGVVPPTNANVLIPQNLTVTVDFVSTTVLRTIRVDGTLQFATTMNTGLTVDTIVVSPTGTFTMGTATAPIPADKMAKVIFADRGAMDATWDPRQFSRGLISHGTVSLYGAEVTSYLPLARAPVQGDTQLVLTQVPTNWKQGDRLVITGTTDDGKQDEEREILALSGTQVTIRPLAYNHGVPRPDLRIYVANVSRNVVLESQNVYVQGRRGHVMFMHSDHVDVHNAGFYGLGRTDKRFPANDPVLDANGQLVANTGTNARGRYAVHFHRTGIDADEAPIVVKGNAVVDSPGWGFVNHSGHVNFEENVAFDVDGAAFVTEAGDEIGAFRRNLAIRATGSGQGIESRTPIQDFGHDGLGFWFQGGAGLEVEGNIAVSTVTGYIYYNLGLVQGGLGTTEFLAANLVDPSIALGQATIAVTNAPLRLFKGNLAFASGRGFESWWHMLDPKHTARSMVEDFTAWGVRTAMFLPYTSRMTVRNTTLFGNPDRPAGIGVQINDLNSNMRYENLHVEGFTDGLWLSQLGSGVVEGGYYANLFNIKVLPPRVSDRVLTIQDNVQFAQLNVPTQQYNIFLQNDLKLQERDITRYFDPNVVRLGTIMYNGKQLYYNEQASDYVPFPVGQAASYIPRQLIGLTNRQMWDRYGLSIGGLVAPANATRDPRVSGVLGDPVSSLSKLTLVSAKYSKQMQGYQLVYRNSQDQEVVDPQLVNLKQGWNLITRTIEGQVRTFLVYGDGIPPTFQLNSNIKLVINAADLTKGFRVEGQVLDDSFGSTPYSKVVTGLDQLQLQARPDGSKYVALQFAVGDLAGNSTTVKLDLTIDFSTVLPPTINPITLTPRQLSETLLALLGYKVVTA